MINLPKWSGTTNSAKNFIITALISGLSFLSTEAGAQSFVKPYDSQENAIWYEKLLPPETQAYYNSAEIQSLIGKYTSAHVLTIVIPATDIKSGIVSAWTATQSHMIGGALASMVDADITPQKTAFVDQINAVLNGTKKTISTSIVSRRPEGNYYTLSIVAPFNEWEGNEAFTAFYQEWVKVLNSLKKSLQYDNNGTKIESIISKYLSKENYTTK